MPAIGGRNYSNGDAAIGIGLVVAFIAVFLPWYSVSYNCAGVTGFACGAFNTSWGALSDWAGWLFFLAVLVGLAFFILRTFVPSVELPDLPQSDGVIFAIIGVFMAVMAILYLLTYGGGVASSGPGYSVGPSFGLFIGLVAAIAVAVGGYLKRSDAPAAPRTYPTPTTYGGGTPPPPPA